MPIFQGFSRRYPSGEVEINSRVVGNGIVDHRTFNPQVVGSIPTGPTKLVSIWSEDFAPRQELNVSANGLLMRRVEQRGEVPCRLLLKAS